jgi:uncharacterized DUF497 family protein
MYVQFCTYAEAGLRWIWDREKDRANRQRHKLPISVGEVALADPLAVSKPDSHPDGDRWDTVADVDGMVLFVVHTWPESDDMPGRIISVRRATTHERKVYEDGD